MKRNLMMIIITAILICLMPAAVYARKGDCGYEGGISSGEAEGKASYDYQEVSFITGEPAVFKGTLSIKKSSRTDVVTSTYIYNLKNLDRAASLTRTLVFKITLKKADDGQIIEDATLTRFSEIIKTSEKTYSLKKYDLSNTSLTDSRPAVNYYSGNIIGTKVYQVGAGTGISSNSETVTIKSSGSFYGYDQYWGTAEVGEINYSISSEQKKSNKVIRWGGTAKTAFSSSVAKKIKYAENEPYQISFPGGYVQTQYNNSILEYSCKLPEFDANGNPTDNMLNPKGSLKLETAPVQTRLLVSDLAEIKGHWAEKEIELLCSLEVLKSSNYLNPEQIITRAEFVSAIVNVVKEVPQDPALASKISRAQKVKKAQIVSPFIDVSVDSMYFNSIDSAVKRGIVNGRGDAVFSPNSGITLADAITIFIRTLGLEGLASNPKAVTTFKDNDLIPAYARSSVYVAQKIGLIKGDGRGYLMPLEKLTKARAAALFNNLISYMQSGINKDYRDRFVNYQ